MLFRSKRGSQGASRAAPGKSGLHARSEGERVIALESWEGSVLPMNIQNWFPLGLTGLISLQSMYSQESSPTPQFKSISSLVLSFLYGPTLTSIHDYWKSHSFDYMNLCWQNDVSAFKYTV